MEHGLRPGPQPVKAYAIAPMYRYGRPGRGRYREHWQLSLEAIGSADPAIDAEVIQFYAELLRRLGVTEWELRLNSIGDAACRPASVGRLAAWLDAQHPLPRPGWVALFRKSFRFTGGESVNEFLMSLGYLRGAHAPHCPVHARILRLDPPWNRETPK